MLEESLPGTPNSALVPVDPDWQPIFHRSNQVVLYNPRSHALAIRQSSQFPKRTLLSLCPYCHRPISGDSDAESDAGSDHSESGIHSRASNYFQLLAVANETSSRPSTPPTPIHTSSNGKRRTSTAFPAEMMAEGYFQAFFQEECRLGMGANGSVFLCQHVLDGTPLGHFAVKKIAVGESHSYLLKILREVRLLERLHHPNIITYHHTWLETCQFSLFGPKVPTLHVLMQWAEGGSLDDFIDARQGRSTQNLPVDPFNPDTHLFSASGSDAAAAATPAPISSLHRKTNLHSRSARIRAFRELQRVPPDERDRMRRGMGSSNPASETWTPVHLLSAEEVKGLFSDVVGGLGFLHEKSILHLDLKPGNVLLTWDDGKLVPRAMLSDFGTSRDMIHSSRPRSGNTGTLEYASPESLPSPETGLLQQVDSKADMWSLGMILHKLLFFRLPYHYAPDGDACDQGDTPTGILDGDKMQRLENEVLSYTGFKTTQVLITAFERRRLPRAFLVLLESLLNIIPSGRPSCERVSSAIRDGRLDPISLDGGSASSLMPVIRRLSDPSAHVSSSDGIQTEALPNTRVPRKENETPGLDGSSQPTYEKDVLIPSEEKNGEKMPLLGLPAPSDKTSIGHARLDLLGIRASPILWIRIVKSLLLVGKVCSIASICPDFRTWPALSYFLLFMAVIDTWFDELWITVFLGVFHIFMLRLGCPRNRCCS